MQQLCEVWSYGLLLSMMAPFFLVLLAASPVFAVPEDKDLVQHRGLIVGGAAAGIEEFPFIVNLFLEMNIMNQSHSGHFCGGTIITEDWVLTAAHCLATDKRIPIDLLMQLIVLRAGSSFIDKRGITRRSTKIVSHEFPPHDIALMKVGEPWPFNRITISPARLPRQGDPVPVHSPATIVGWGFTDDLHTPPDILMMQQVVVISHAYCKAAYFFWTKKKITVNDTNICTLFDFMKAPSSAFSGDSGGPVVVNGEVLGIASFGPNETVSTTFFPNIHTRVSSYIDWIEENVGPLPRAK